MYSLIFAYPLTENTPVNPSAPRIHTDQLCRLHKEITDFISYIQPRAYEHAVRRHLVSRMRTIINSMWSDTDVRVFGSFAAELYLPTSDIDLVIVSESYAWYDVPKYATKRHLRDLGAKLRMAGMTEIQIIAKAKVPIIKFVDPLTNISVDISFENASGMVANETFQRWKAAYPAMPILVLLVKHYLSIRGLNEPYSGGLGSFSVTCLVISLLQLLPSVRSGRIDPRLHLGVMLLEFLELYGKNFNTEVVGIRVDEDAPGYFLKQDISDTRERPTKSYQLVIQDPNNPINDVSRSSHAIRLILACFSDAYDELVAQMTLLDRLPFSKRTGRSILGVIIGGNYSYADRQRTRMQEIYVTKIGPLKHAEAMEKALKDEEDVRKANKEEEFKAGRESNGAQKRNEEQQAEGEVGAPHGDVGNGEPKEKTTRGRRVRKEARNAKHGVASNEAGADISNTTTATSEAAYKGESNQEVIVID